jgi:hypothetical protein
MHLSLNCILRNGLNVLKSNQGILNPEGSPLIWISIKVDVLFGPGMAPHYWKARTQETRVYGKEIRFIQGLALRRWRSCHPQSSILGNSGTGKDFHREGKKSQVGMWRKARC